MTFAELRKRTIAEGKKAVRQAEEQLRESFPNGQIPVDEVRAVLSPILRKLHDNVNELTADTIDQMNRKAGVGIRPLSSEYDIERENELVEEVSRRSFEDGFSW